MTAKVEGTVILDGLVQGKVSNLPGAEQRLRDWEQFAKSTKLNFNLEIAGGTFGFLADQSPIAASDLGHDPAETIESAIGELLKTFAPAERASVFSTLRSVEYRKDEEVQTLYVIGPNGAVLARGRTVSALTAAPPAQLTLRDHALHITVGAVLLLLLLMASSLFIDYHRMFTSLSSQLRPLDAAHFPVEATEFPAVFYGGEQIVGQRWLRPDHSPSPNRCVRRSAGDADFSSCFYAEQSDRITARRCRGRHRLRALRILRRKQPVHGICLTPHQATARFGDDELAYPLRY